MRNILIVNKPVGKTPLDIIKELKANNSDLKDTKIGYAGRLDPMAEGVLVLLVGEENKNRDAYLKLDKEYEVEILFGVCTDSYDVLGKITQYKTVHVSDEMLHKTIDNFKGEILQQYPPYSSKVIRGKPLFYWAREGKLGSIVIPSKKRHIYSIEINSMSDESMEDVKNYIQDKLKSVSGVFRQEEIIKGWEDFFQKNKQTSFQVAKIHVSCSSGTYMRTLAFDIGNELNVPALTYHIKRTRVGDFMLEDK